METQTHRLWAEGDEHVLPYCLLLTISDDPYTEIQADGYDAPEEVHAASFTFDDDGGSEHPEEGIIYLPPDALPGTVAHEAAHAIIGIYHRRGIPTPSRNSGADDEEAFTHTLGTLTQQIIDTLSEEAGDGTQ